MYAEVQHTITNVTLTEITLENEKMGNKNNQIQNETIEKTKLELTDQIKFEGKCKKPIYEIKQSSQQKPCNSPQKCMKILTPTQTVIEPSGSTCIVAKLL